MGVSATTQVNNNIVNHPGSGKRSGVQSRAFAARPAHAGCCFGCFQQEHCSLFRLMDLAQQAGQAAVLETWPLAAGSSVCRTGDEHEGIFVIKSGAAKSSLISMDSGEQILAFHLPGDLLGLDSLGTGRYGSTVTTLERSTVCKLPARQLDDLISRDAGLLRWFLDTVGVLLASYQQHFSVLGGMRAEARLCRFLLEQSRRYQEHGCAANEFNLIMTRQDISSYLGVALETVSRIVARLHRDGIINVDRRRITILDADRLEALAHSSAVDASNWHKRGRKTAAAKLAAGLR